MKVERLHELVERLHELAKSKRLSPEKYTKSFDEIHNIDLFIIKKAKRIYVTAMYPPNKLTVTLRN